MSNFRPNTQQECEELDYAVWNPQGKSLDDLPFIFGFNNGGSPEMVSGALIAQDGTGLGGHICSHERYMHGDLGVTSGSRPDRHEGFQKHYPDGYVMDFVSHNEVMQHPVLVRAFELNDALRAASEEASD